MVGSAFCGGNTKPVDIGGRHFYCCHRQTNKKTVDQLIVNGADHPLVISIAAAGYPQQNHELQVFF